MNEPKYNPDILDQLRFAVGAPAAVLRIQEDLGNIQQTLTRAADEIEKLRKRVKKLEKGNGGRIHSSGRQPMSTFCARERALMIADRENVLAAASEKSKRSQRSSRTEQDDRHLR